KALPTWQPPCSGPSRKRSDFWGNATMIDQPESQDQPTRREFAATVALLGLVPALPAGTATPGEPKAGDAIAQTAEDLVAIARRRHAKHWPEDQTAWVRRRIQGKLRSAEQMKRMPVTNADEPAFIFRADLP